MEHPFSGRDLILIFGGLFLLYKSATEIYDNVEAEEDDTPEADVRDAAQKGMMIIVMQIAVIDIVFSLDSVITAVGLSQDIPVMVIAVMTSVLVMMFAAKTIGEFVENHPSIKMLALAFLIMVGTILIIDGFGIHVPKGYLYAAMAFSLAVEALNIRLRGKAQRRARRRHRLMDKN
jgi:predicted tellurium resistance membrane protein TerC